MLQADIAYLRLEFRFAARTSRDTLRYKDAYFLKLFRSENPEVFGVGEFNYFPGLASDATDDYARRVEKVCRAFNRGEGIPRDMSSVNFAFETAMRDLASGGRHMPFETEWSLGKIPLEINGLIWMGSHDEMLGRIKNKLDEGFRLLKLKIGGIDFEEELDLLSTIRKTFSADDLELRLDANGSFRPEEAPECLERLARYDIHSIEQPIKAGNPEVMREICLTSPIAIALDEELIGVRDEASVARLLETISPRYVIIKPALCGGFDAADAIVHQASRLGIGWWATSALESDIGLNAIAHWTASRQNPLPQGLGTGQLYTNNIMSPIRLRGNRLYHDPSQEWDFSCLKWKNLPNS